MGSIRLIRGDFIKKSLLLFTILYANITSGQSFQISQVPAVNYSLDKFANEVYYGSYVKNLNDSTIRFSPFPTLPVFANKSHQCVYGDGDSLFIYNFDTGSRFKVYDSVSYYEYTFSPNDEYLLFYLHYFSFADSTVYEMDFSPGDFIEYDWVNETNLIYSFNENYMYLYNYITNELDTLFFTNLPISTYAYNMVNGQIYYSLDEYEYPKIHSYNMTTRIDSIVFDTENDTNDNCWWTYNWFQEMEWSPDSSRMAFFSYILDAGGTIYTYVPADKRLYKYTNCGGEGYEYHLKWLNNDTIVYSNASLGFIYGFVLDDPLAIREINSNDVPASLELYQNYPNPFNPITNITYSIPRYGLVTLKVYNTLGEEVATLVNEEKPAGSYELTWGAGDLPSGVYFYQLKSEGLIQTKKMILLK